MGRSILRPYFFGRIGERAPTLFSGERSAYNRAMAFTLRSYEPHDFAALHKLDQACFPPGISYSKATLRYFLKLPSADCVVAAEGSHIAGFALSEENPPLAHIITLDVEEKQRRNGVGTALLQQLESNLAARGVRSVLLETAIDNEAAVAFWQRHGYGIEATLRRYYLGRLDAYEMRKLLQPKTKTERHPGEKN
jgi:[ribosomal protein S18]-alanine N-acetyltransferase